MCFFGITFTYHLYEDKPMFEVGVPICPGKLYSRIILSRHTQDVEPMLVLCWPTVYDAGPTMNQYWVMYCVFSSSHTRLAAPEVVDRGLVCNLGSSEPCCQEDVFSMNPISEAHLYLWCLNS